MEQDDFYSATEAAKKLRVTVQTLYRWARVDPDFPKGTRLGKGRFWSRAFIDALYSKKLIEAGANHV